MPDQLPAGIDVDITALQVGDKLTAADVQLPEGVSLISSEDSLLASVVLTRAAESAEETEDAEAAKEEAAEEAK